MLQHERFLNLMGEITKKAQWAAFQSTSTENKRLKRDEKYKHAEKNKRKIFWKK